MLSTGRVFWPVFLQWKIPGKRVIHEACEIPLENPTTYRSVQSEDKYERRKKSQESFF